MERNRRKFTYVIGIIFLFVACGSEVSGNEELWLIETSESLDTRKITEDIQGQPNEVHLISTWRDLEYISAHFENEDMKELLTYRYEITADIEFPDRREAPLGERGYYYTQGFTPIGRKGGDGQNALPFTGYFDGNNRVISNLFVDKKNQDGVGLFGYVSGEDQDSIAEIKNLHMIRGEIEGRRSVGLLVGHVGANTIISGNTVNGNVSGDSSVGGLLGNVQGNIDDAIIISNNISSGSVKGGEAVGGLIGNSLTVRLIENSGSDAHVKGMDGVGGLIGKLYETTVTESYAKGMVLGDRKESRGIGGLVGSALSINIRNSFSNGSVTGIEKIGGLIGWIQSPRIAGEASSTIEKSYANGLVVGEKEAGRLFGRIDNGTFSHVYARDLANDGVKELAGQQSLPINLQTVHLINLRNWNFHNWDVGEGNSVWQRKDKNTWPTLRWQSDIRRD